MDQEQKKPPKELREWHRLFGLVLQDFFTGSPFDVETEVDLSKKQQYLDILKWGTEPIRIVVLGQLPLLEHNAPLHLFSASRELVQYGTKHYHQRSNNTSTVIDQLFDRYRLEGGSMPYTMEDFRWDYLREHVVELPPKERLKGLSPAERLEGLSPAERLEGLSPEKRLEGLSPEKRLEGLSPEERLKGLSEKEIEVLRKLLQADETRAGSG